MDRRRCAAPRRRLARSLRNRAGKPGPRAIAALFAPDSHWCDLLAFTWALTPHRWAHRMAAAYRRPASPRSRGTTCDSQQPYAAARVRRLGSEPSRRIFEFETAHGRGTVSFGSSTLPGSKPSRPGSCSTALEELRGFEESGPARAARRASPIRATSAGQLARPAQGSGGLRRPRSGGARRRRRTGGLSIAARLASSASTRWSSIAARIGDNWRTRYHALTLHNQMQVNHLPYMPFPPSWPTYIPKDKLAGWFEAYVESLELNFWTGTEFDGGSYDEAAGRWTVSLRRADGTRAHDAAPPPRVRHRRERHPQHPGAAGARGLRRHGPALQPVRRRRRLARQERAGARHRQQRPRHRPGPARRRRRRRRWSSAARPLFVNIEPSAQLPYALYDEGRRWRIAI